MSSVECVVGKGTEDDLFRPSSLPCSASCLDVEGLTYLGDKTQHECTLAEARPDDNGKCGCSDISSNGFNPTLCNAAYKGYGDGTYGRCEFIPGDDKCRSAKIFRDDIRIYRVMCNSPPPPSPPPPLPAPPDQTSLIVGISLGAVALVLLFVIVIVILFRRTAPARAAAKARRTLTAIGLIARLKQAGVSGDEQVLERATAWVTANKPASVEDLIRFGMVQGFVDSLNLPAIPRQKLLAALEGHEATPFAMGTVVDEQKELGGVQLSRSAGAAASSSTQPTLIQAAEILKRELRLEGSLKDVVQQAAAQLGIEPGPPLTELAQQCLRELRPGMTQEV